MNKNKRLIKKIYKLAKPIISNDLVNEHSDSVDVENKIIIFYTSLAKKVVGEDIAQYMKAHKNQLIDFFIEFYKNENVISLNKELKEKPLECMHVVKKYENRIIELIDNYSKQYEMFNIFENQKYDIIELLFHAWVMFVYNSIENKFFKKIMENVNDPQYNKKYDISVLNVQLFKTIFEKIRTIFSNQSNDLIVIINQLLDNMF